MSELENVHARPALTPLILSESPHRLTPRNAASIVAFMFKQAVICHFMDKTSARYRPLFPAATLRRFAKTLEIPKNVQVWTASFRSETRHGTLRMRYKDTPLGAVNGFQLYAFTYSVGFFCGQMTIGRWTQTYRFDCALGDGIRSCD